jgi:hypothetical protein
VHGILGRGAFARNPASVTIPILCFRVPRLAGDREAIEEFLANGGDIKAVDEFLESGGQITPRPPRRRTRDPANSSSPTLMRRG